jgi:hypothetical protein
MLLLSLVVVAYSAHYFLSRPNEVPNAFVAEWMVR